MFRIIGKALKPLGVVLGKVAGDAIKTRIQIKLDQRGLEKVLKSMGISGTGLVIALAMKEAGWIDGIYTVAAVASLAGVAVNLLRKLFVKYGVDVPDIDTEGNPDG
jgi:hypothetical protein